VLIANICNAFEQWLARQATPLPLPPPIDRINNLPVLAQGQVKIRERCPAGHADPSDGLTPRNDIPLRHPDTATPQVTILAFPATRVTDNNAIAAFPALDLFCRETESVLGDVVSQPQDRAGSNSAHINTALHLRKIADRKVSPFVPVIAARTAGTIGNGFAPIMIDIVHDPAGRAEIAFKGQVKRRAVTGNGRKGLSGKQNRYNGKKTSAGGARANFQKQLNARRRFWYRV